MDTLAQQPQGKKLYAERSRLGSETYPPPSWRKSVPYGSQRNNLRKTEAIIRQHNPDTVAQVYKAWNPNAMAAMAEQMPQARANTAEALVRQMFSEPTPVQHGGYNSNLAETRYLPGKGYVVLTEPMLSNWPVNTYTHEQAHALQSKPSAIEDELSFDMRSTGYRQPDDTEHDYTAYMAANELAPTLTGNLAEYEARRRSGSRPLQNTPPLTRGYAPSMEWMRQMAAKHGLYRGVPMERLLADNPQWVRMLAQQKPYSAADASKQFEEAKQRIAAVIEKQRRATPQAENTNWPVRAAAQPYISSQERADIADAIGLRKESSIGNAQYYVKQRILPQYLKALVAGNTKAAEIQFSNQMQRAQKLYEKINWGYKKPSKS